MASRSDASGVDLPLSRVEADVKPVRHGLGRLLDLPPVRRLSRVLDVYNRAGGSLLAEGLAYSALFAGLTGLLLCVGLLGYFVPSDADRQRIIDSFTGELAPFASIARGGLNSVAANASAFSIAGLAGLAWGASHFYGALDQAISRVFDRTPARAALDRLVRGFVSLLLLVGGLVSGVGISVVQAEIRSRINTNGDFIQSFNAIAFPLATAIVVIVAVGIVYRVVPNTKVPVSVLWLPALVAGIGLTILAELLVYLAPLLTGSLSVFGGLAAVFAALAWLHLAFQVLLIGASWTRVRLDDRTGGHA